MGFLKAKCIDAEMLHVYKKDVDFTMEFLNKVWEACSNQGHATIIGAIITASGAIVAAIIAAICSKHKKGKEGVIPIPPEVEPLAGLKADSAGLKGIGQEKFNNKKYVEALATRMELLKNRDSHLDVFYEEDKHERHHSR